MPRKSAAALAVWMPPENRPKPLAPPSDLTADQKRIWADVVSCRPADFFDGACGILLAQYCRHVTTANTLAKAINGTEPTDKRYRALLEMAARQSTMLSMLSAKLRLAPQHVRRAETRVPTLTAVPPWGKHL
jgi:hypothetical protein